MNNNTAFKDVYEENEIKANYLTCAILGLFALTVLFFSIFYTDDVVGDVPHLQTLYIIIIAVAIVSVIICLIFKARGKWIKYMLLCQFLLTTSTFSLFSTSAVAALFSIIPLCLSCRYYSKSFTIFIGLIISITTVIVFTYSAYYNYANSPDLNLVVLPEGVSMTVSGNLFRALKGVKFDTSIYTARILYFTVFPIIILYVVILATCVSVCDAGKTMIDKQKLITEQNTKMNGELVFASIIQKNMLPSSFPKGDNYNTYGFTMPARHVGGDFYDLFKIDDNKIGIVIGDVSDKGVPAALFMVETKTLINNFARHGYLPHNAFSEINNTLCNGNNENMFVTAFFGIIDLEKETLTFANAGHCPPLLKRKDGNFEYLKVDANLFLAGMNDIEYTKQEIKFSKGDKLFLYSDGVIEATRGDDALYGEERLLNFINTVKDQNLQVIANSVLDDISVFVNGNEQNDDITIAEFEIK